MRRKAQFIHIAVIKLREKNKPAGGGGDAAGATWQSHYKVSPTGTPKKLNRFSENPYSRRSVCLAAPLVVAHPSGAANRANPQTMNPH